MHLKELIADYASYLQDDSWSKRTVSF